MESKNYSPYCGNNIPKKEKGGCSNPRTYFNGNQFFCKECNWISSFDFEFIKRYKSKWNI